MKIILTDATKCISDGVLTSCFRGGLYLMLLFEPLYKKGRSESPSVENDQLKDTAYPHDPHPSTIHVQFADRPCAGLSRSVVGNRRVLPGKSLDSDPLVSGRQLDRANQRAGAELVGRRSN
jgi:hypothetical protein